MSASIGEKEEARRQSRQEGKQENQTMPKETDPSKVLISDYQKQILALQNQLIDLQGRSIANPNNPNGPQNF